MATQNQYDQNQYDTGDDARAFEPSSTSSTQIPPASRPRFVLGSSDDRHGKTGHHDESVWWPQSRRLSDELAQLFAAWPPGAGRIARVLYSPPDWDDRPRAVAIPGRSQVKTGNFPHDDTHQLVLTMLDGHRHTVAVIPPETAPAAAEAMLARTETA